MSDFDLRKFLAEQKAAKVETVKEEEAVQEEAIEEVETQEEAVEETYHEGEDTMEEGDMDEEFKHPEADKAWMGVLNAITNFRKIGNKAYGGEKQDIYTSAAGNEFKALDKAISDLGNKIRLQVEDHSIKEDTMEEGDVTESVIGGIAALVGGTVALGKLLDYLKSKGYELTDPKGKSVIDTTIRGLKKEEEAHEGEEMEEEVNEEELKENTFKASIKDILNS